MKITDEKGNRLTLKESATRYFNSEHFKPLRESFILMWNFYKAHGLSKLIDHLLYEGGDRQALTNAYNVIGISENASQKTLDQTCRTLSRQWHPDRFVKDPSKKIEAEKKFMEIQAACNMLSEERRNKFQQNKSE